MPHFIPHKLHCYRFCLSKSYQNLSIFKVTKSIFHNVLNPRSALLNYSWEANNPGVFSLIFFSDQAHFHLSEHANKQNMRFWAPNQAHELIQQPLSQEKATVWCAVGKGGIVGPFFFENNDGNPLTVNSERYIQMLQRRFVSSIQRRRNINIQTAVFQRDGAPPHCSNITLEYLRQHFLSDRLLSRRIDNSWFSYHI